MGKLIQIQQIGDIINSLLEKIKIKYATKKEVEDAVELKGPDGKAYRMVIDNDYKLKAVEYVNTRQADYLMSGVDYYYIEEDSLGNASLVKANNIEENASLGYVRTMDIGTCTKYQIAVENNQIVFNECDQDTTDLEAKYLTCKNNPNKLYSFKIYEGIVYLESMTIETKSISLK